MRGEREIQREGRPEPQPDAARGYGAAVRFNDEAYDIKAQPDADLVLRRRGLDPSVFAEDHADMRSREADALILHQDAGSVLASADRDVNGRPWRREAQSIVEDVLDRGAKTLHIRVDP